MRSVENGEVSRALLIRTSKVLRQLARAQSAGRTSGPRYEHLVRRANRVTKQSAALLEEMSRQRTG